MASKARKAREARNLAHSKTYTVYRRRLSIKKKIKSEYSNCYGRINLIASPGISNNSKKQTKE